jgi:Asp/Glu/hydantoin racemase
MQAKRIFLIHATPLSMAPIADAFRRLWPEPQLLNLLDDSLSKDMAASGMVTAELKERFLSLTHYAVGAGADAILFTCSAFGEAIDACKEAVTIPVLKPNEAMIDEALSKAAYITLLATFKPSIGSMLEEFQLAASEAGKALRVISIHVPGAIEALSQGDRALHDDAIADAARSVQDSELICFSQFSMTSAAAQTQMARGLTVLTTPDSAVKRLRFLLEG